MNKVELRGKLLKDGNINYIIKKSLKKDYFMTIDTILDTIFYLMKCGSKRESTVSLLVKQLEKLANSNLSCERLQILYGLISQFNVDKLSTLSKGTVKHWEIYINRIHDIIYLDSMDIRKIFISRSELATLDIEKNSEEDFELTRDRVDYTEQNVITIDGPDSRCLDDGICLESLDDGSYNLYIHIIDIPSIVSYDSNINKEAFKLKQSMYFPNFTIPLFPDYISYNRGSLLPFGNRNVITYKFRVDPNYNVLFDTLEINRGIVAVKHCFKYNEVDKKINSGIYGDTEIMLRKLAMIASKLRKNNVKKDNYRNLENYLLRTNHTNSAMADKSNAANLVQEMMILINHGTSEYFKNMGFPFIYRANSNNSGIPYDMLLNTILDNKDKLTSDDYKCIKGQILSSYYTASPCHHDGLNLSTYSHVSSPARRYVDYVNQYLFYESQKELEDSRVYELENVAKSVASFVNNDTDFGLEFRKNIADSYKKFVKRRKI